MAVFAIGLFGDVLAVEKQDHAQIYLCGPATGHVLPGPSEFIILVVEGPTISYDTNTIPNADVVEYVNKLLEIKNVSYIGIYTREGTKYGDVVRALDVLRDTKAKSIGISMKELAIGRVP